MYERTEKEDILNIIFIILNKYDFARTQFSWFSALCIKLNLITK